MKESELSFIVIEQAMFGTDVWLNDQYLGGEIACYTSQEYDIRSAVRVGTNNDLIVRVGQRENLPPHNAAGNDQERTEWIPGIWGDVYVLQCGNPRVKLVQIIPQIENAAAEVRVSVKNYSSDEYSISVSSALAERHSGKNVGAFEQTKVMVPPGRTESLRFVHSIPDMQLWSPENPFLYESEAVVERDGNVVDAVRTRFGMREFKVVGSDFYLNGKRIFLRGGNIAFHRFLSDADRGTLPWQLDWIKKLLIDIPKTHNFNFFRNHLGQMYNRWYDIADEYGMLLQNEWMFWTTTGTRDQITREFTRWLEDNRNHPSIIIWDALNECTDSVVQNEVVPELKKLDPTRPWESVDFVEEHPYIYSLGPVLNAGRFGFARSLEEIENSTTPTMLNEFCWWWLDKDFNPSSLTKDVVERWLGPAWTKEQLVAHQSFLVQELVELFRRMKVDAIQPFVYLSNNAGPTANWFADSIETLQPKPILATLANAFAPFGVSIELWDRHFLLSESRVVSVFVFNDKQEGANGVLRCGIVNTNAEWTFETRLSVCINASDRVIIPLNILFPSQEGEFKLRAELLDRDNNFQSYSEKVIHVFGPVETPAILRSKLVALLEPDDELQRFLTDRGITVSLLNEINLQECDLLLVAQNSVRGSDYQARLGIISKFLESGKSVIVIEPEYDVTEKETVVLALGVEVTIERREDLDKGGYDSYVFADDSSAPVWNGILPEHLKMFNGSFGGEVVSQHNVMPNVSCKIHARCGMHLGVSAVCEIPFGKGRIILSRLQMRRRLNHAKTPDNQNARRVDPVIQRYFMNLLTYALKV
jgi:hypothetical protein